MSDLFPISDDDLRTQFRIAVGIEIQKFPQLKGKGRAVPDMVGKP